MTMEYVRRYYGVPAKRGMRVRFRDDGRRGTIARATHYVWVRFDGDRFAVPCHPTYNLIYCLNNARTTVAAPDTEGGQTA